MTPHTWLHSFENEGEAQMIRSERQRSALILAVLGLFLITNTLLHLLSPRWLDELFSHRFPTLPSFLGSGMFTLYEILYFSFLTRSLKTGYTLPNFARFGNALLETSIPTIAMVVAARSFTPVAALDSPFYILYFLFIILSALRMNPGLSLFTSAVACLEYLGVGLSFLPPHNTDFALMILRDGLLLLAGILSAFVSARVRASVFAAWRSLEDKNRVMNLFGQHVSPAVVQKLLDQPQELLSENLPVTVLFLDIRNFTGYAEKRTPEEVVNFLNHLFDFMIDVINRHHGIINKFLGDGFLAVFGAPLHEGNSAQNALKAGLELRKELAQRVQSGQTPPTKIGIGIHSGPAVTGTVGSVQRREYTVIGNVVNTASRLESLNKELGTTILVSDTVWQEGHWDSLVGIDRGEVKIRGKDNLLRVWEIPEEATYELDEGQANPLY